MPRNTRQWTTLNDPALGTFTNTLVNYYEGVIIKRATPSPTHILPDSYDGKVFHINNDNLSAFPVLVQVTTQNGPETFQINAGDSGIFVYNGNSSWDQIGGEAIIISLAGSAAAAQSQIFQTIRFDDPPNVGLTTFVLGSVPLTATVSDVAINVLTPFNAGGVPTPRTVRITDNTGGIILMDDIESDIARVQNYAVTYPTRVVSPINGDILAIFDAPVNTGTTGELTVLVEYQTI